MPRKKPKYVPKNKRRQWGEENMAKAICAVREKKMGTLKASKTFNVPRGTLRDLSKKVDVSPSKLVTAKIGRKPILGDELEKQLVDYLLHMEAKFYGFTLGDLRRMAFQLATRNGINHPFKQGQAGRAWVDLFLERHKDALSLRKPCGTSFSRALGFKKESVGAFFQLLEETYLEYKYPADRVYNVDETGLTIVQSKIPQVIGRKGKRQVAALTSAERGATVTVIACMSASGYYVPPFIIFPRKNMNEQLMRGAPPGSVGIAHPSDPPEISVERPVVHSAEGFEAQLVCIVHGESQPEVLWYRDTMQLDTTERRIMESRGSRHTLIIRKVHRTDFGNYTCVADNQLGKTRKSIQLTGKPNPAKFNSASRGSWKDSYNISWAVESLSPIEEYKLLFRRLPDTNSEDGHPQPLHHQSQRKFIPGRDNKTYAAVGYSVGYGYGRQFIDKRTDWRDVILLASPSQSPGVQSMSYVIRGLEPAQNYEAKVQARNKFGWSPISEVFTFQTTDTDMSYPDRPQSPRHVYNEHEVQDLLGIRAYNRAPAQIPSRTLAVIIMICTFLKILS